MTPSCSPPPSTTSRTIVSLRQVGETVSRGRWKGHYPHMRLISRHLMRVTYGLSRRKVVQMPPRHGKTFLIGRVFPFYHLTQHPGHDIIYVSSTGAIASEQGEYIRSLIDDFGRDFGIQVSRKSHAKDNFDIVDLDGQPTGGSVRCVGATAAVHGRGAHLLLLDDLYGTLDDVLSPAYRESVWRTYTSSLHTRLTPTGAVVALGTPFHYDDWFGRTKRAEADGGDLFDWVRLHAFARPDDPLGRPVDEPLWPDGGWDADALVAKRDQMRAAGNYRDWRAQYDLEPVSGDGVSEWPDDYFRHIHDPYAPKGTPWTSVLAIDTSKGSSRSQKKGDFQAFAYASSDAAGHVSLDCEMHRLDVKGLLAKSLELIRRHHPRWVVVETNGAGYALLEALWDVKGLESVIVGRHHDSTENKILRITQRLGAALHAGVLHFAPTPHNRLVVDQLRLFPHAEYDDGPDAVEMALEMIACDRLRTNKQPVKVTYQTRATPR